MRNVFYLMRLGLLSLWLVPTVTLAVHQENSASMDSLSRIGEQGTLYRQAEERLRERMQRNPQDHEASLLLALIEFKSGAIEEALSELASLLKREPKFHLAHLIQGDMLLAQTRVVSDIGQSALLQSDKKSKDDLGLLRQEAEARLASYLESLPQGRLPRALLSLDDDINHAVLVDKHSHRLYVYRRGSDGTPELIRDYYVSTGKANGNKQVTGDLRTPEGVYFITSHIPGEKLPDLYGIGAYPMNYPNEWDLRQGKTGYGIWLHGTESAYYSRPPLDSEGCVVLPNIDLGAVSDYLQPGTTPIVVTDRVEWLERDAYLALRAEVRGAVEKWRADWQGSDVERYLSHYDDKFWAKGHNKKSWQARKRRVAAGKEWQKIEFNDISLFAYPRAAGNGEEMMVVNLKQDYRSNNYSSAMDKRIYLVKADSGWRVLYEGGR
ncbi:MAG: tetratricopeptide repeat protein [Chromatiales bacterium]|nr:tetratricopeptide repeat protein [Chromatiales bacterium]